MNYQELIRQHICVRCRRKLREDYWYTECVECRKARAEKYRAQRGEKAKAHVSYEEEATND